MLSTEALLVVVQGKDVEGHLRAAVGMLQLAEWMLHIGLMNEKRPIKLHFL